MSLEEYILSLEEGCENSIIGAIIFEKNNLLLKHSGWKKGDGLPWTFHAPSHTRTGPTALVCLIMGDEINLKGKNLRQI